MDLNTTLPKFFLGESNRVDAGYETMQDFFLSWTLRCSMKDYRCVNKKLFDYAQKVVYYLIYGENKEDKGEGYSYFELSDLPPNDFTVESVKIWRQWGKIDVLAEIEIQADNKIEKHLLNIENKFYTPIRDGQIESSKQVIESDTRYRDFNVSHMVIFCDNELLGPAKAYRKNCEFKLLSVLDIMEYAGMWNNGRTGNALFDEYWFNSNKM